jgi:hypothetical protein
VTARGVCREPGAAIEERRHQYNNAEDDEREPTAVASDTCATPQLIRVGQDCRGLIYFICDAN